MFCYHSYKEDVLIPVRREISLKDICEKVKFSNGDFAIILVSINVHTNELFQNSIYAGLPEPSLLAGSVNTLLTLLSFPRTAPLSNPIREASLVYCFPALLIGMAI